MKLCYIMIFVAAMLLTCGQVHAGVNFNDFSGTAGLTLNGNAAGNVNNGIDPNPVLRLAAAQTGQVGSTFTTLVEDIVTFSATFEFRITNPGGPHDGTDTGADGITFTIQGIGDTALGGGGSLGYSGIGASVAVEFDTWNNGGGLNDPGSNHLGINTNGGFGGATLAVTPRFDDGNLWYAWIDYDGTTLEVRVNQAGVRPVAADLSRVIDIPTTIGSTTAHVGFTGATGGAFGDHDIVNWNFNHNPDCINAIPSVVTLWPPNHKMVPVSILGVTDLDGDPVTITIAGITSDEPTASDEGSGGAKHAPDAAGVGTDTAILRAESSGTGNGRVYEIWFVADDGMGGKCDGYVIVEVPHDKGKGATPINDGQIYDATQMN
jgi:hypothetical protein